VRNNIVQACTSDRIIDWNALDATVSQFGFNSYFSNTVGSEFARTTTGTKATVTIWKAAVLASSPDSANSNELDPGFRDAANGNFNVLVGGNADGTGASNGNRGSDRYGVGKAFANGATVDQADWDGAGATLTDVTSVDGGNAIELDAGQAVGTYESPVMDLGKIERITHFNVPYVEDGVEGVLDEDVGTAAFVTLTMDTMPTDGDTFTLSGKTYTYEASLTNVDGNINIGGSLAQAKLNLVAALNLTGTPGTDYAAAMTGGDVKGAAFSGDDAVLTAKVPGTGGNSFASTETFTAGTNIFDSATLLGGVSDQERTIEFRVSETTVAPAGAYTTYDIGTTIAVLARKVQIKVTLRNTAI